ncbi:C-type lectin domain family 7 member A-like [Anomaloglossus baeobatrachus]|uniref:C-type lectin domain family 7 member A-like n=1 Tax=Anomaloglossus baeobatrachus TaxID=238106 RepID=UPI003F4FD9BE
MSIITDKQKIWTPFWKVLIVTIVLGVMIILVRMTEALGMYDNSYRLPVNHHTDLEKYRKELSKELCMEKTDNSSGCLLCPPDWRLHRDQCYYYSDVPDRTWSQSREDCKMMGADLLVIKDRKQQDIIQRSITQRGEDTYWIGLHRDGDVWRWVDGGQYNSSLFQIKTQESRGCVVMSRSRYHQEHCNSCNGRICVKKAVRI